MAEPRLRHVSQQAWVANLLGPNQFPDSAEHGVLRQVVVDYFLSRTRRSLLLQVSGATLVAYDARFLWPLAIVCFLSAEAYARAQTQPTLRVASMLWATFGSQDRIPANELDVILERHRLLRRCDCLLLPLVQLFSIFDVVVLIRRAGVALGLLTTCGLLVALVIAHARIFISRIRIFQDRVQNQSAELGREYRLLFRGRTATELRHKRELALGDWIVAMFVLALLIVWLTQPTTYVFNTFLVVVVVTSVWLVYAALADEINITASMQARAPLAPLVSYFLSLHLFHALVLGPIWFVYGVRALGSVVDDPHTHVALLTLIVCSMVGLAEFFLGPLTLRACKRLVASRFNIVYFRRFDEETAIDDRVAMVPVFGAYGRVFLIRDATLETKIKKGIQPQYEDALAQFYALDFFSDNEWRDRVRTALVVADLVVFRWTMPPTDNMLWEFDQARRLLPFERLLWVGDAKSEAELRQFVRENAFENIEGSNVLVFRRRPPFFGFCRAVYRVMRALQPMGRTFPADER